MACHVSTYLVVFQKLHLLANLQTCSSFNGLFNGLFDGLFNGLFDGWWSVQFGIHLLLRNFLNILFIINFASRGPESALTSV